MRQKVLSILALLLVAATGTMAQTETLLTTINNVGNTDFISGSKTFNDIATVTFSGEVGNGGDDSGWYNYTSPDEAINLTVTAVEGYTVTRVKFFCNEGSAFDEETPFEAELVMEVSGMYSNPSTKVNGISIGGYGVTKIEVYGYENPTTVNVTGVTLSETSAEMTVGGDALTLTATVAPENATDQTVTWTTSDATVATVADGVVTAVAAGTATITATATNGTDDTSDDKAATCTVTVAQTYNVTLAEGTEDAENWTISDGTQSANGATGLSGLIGTETVTVTYNGTREVKTVKAVKKAAAAYPLLSAATTSDYGKVVCAAGHLHDAKTAVPAGCTAVGILGKVTDTGHGLILALQNATNQTWNTINGWESVTAYASTTLKLLPDDAARGSLTSYTTLGSTTVSNWAVAQKSDYEAIFTNLGSTKYDVNGYTYDANVNAFITTGVGGSEISGGYCTATQRNGLNAWGFNSNVWGNYSKSTSYSVRPVLGFGGEATPAGPTASTLAESTVGMIVGTDGKAYAVADKDNLPSGVTAAGMVAYKNGSNGLVISLADEANTMNWSTATGASGAAAHTPVVTGGTWKLPSKAEWNQMFGYDADADIANYMSLNDAISTAGGSDLQNALYWSSTEFEDGIAYEVELDLGSAYWHNNGDEDDDRRVRACLAF